MKFLLGLVLTFQFINSPVQAQMGEKPSFNHLKHATDVLTSLQARAFTDDAELMMDELRIEGASKFLQTANYRSEPEKKSVLAILKKTGPGTTPVFKRTKNGDWVMYVYDQKVSMSIVDLYKRQIVINGQTLSYANESIENFEKRVRALLTPTKTTLLKQLWQQVGIPEAQAMEPISALVIGVVAVAILGTALYYIHYRPKAAVERLVEASMDLKSKADSCEGAGQNQQNYESTHSLAGSIAGRSTFNSLTDSQLVLQNELRKNLEASTPNVDCEQSVRSAADKMGIDVPSPQLLATARARREARQSVLGPESATDVTGALFQMCGEYQRLSNCMSQFVSHHVDDGETIEEFGSSTPNFSRYQRNASGR